MKYKVDDKVKIRSWDSMEQEYGLSNTGAIKVPGLFIKQMKKYCDKIVTIKEVYSNYYNIKECGLNWSDDMIDHVATRIMSIIDRLEMLKNLTKNRTDKIAIDGDVMILKSNIPIFSKMKVIYYNEIFRKIKGKTK